MNRVFKDLKVNRKTKNGYKVFKILKGLFKDN